MLVVISRDRSDLGLLNLMDRRVVALTLIHRHTVVEEEAVGKSDDLLLRDRCHPVDGLHLLFPRLIIDEGIDTLGSTVLIGKQALVILKAKIGHHAGEQALVEVTLLQFVDLSEDQLPHLLQRLSLTGHSFGNEHAIVVHQLHAGYGILYLHRLVEIKIHQAGRTVAQQGSDHIQRVGSKRVGTRRLPAHKHILSLLADNGRVDRSGQHRHGSILGTAQRR